jgi:hypothetical protein
MGKEHEEECIEQRNKGIEKCKLQIAEWKIGKGVIGNRRLALKQDSPQRGR